VAEESDSLDWADLQGIWDWHLDGRYDPLPESPPTTAVGSPDALDPRQADRLDELLTVLRRLGLAEVLAESDDDEIRPSGTEA
jgi:hypothetical protein